MGVAGQGDRAVARGQGIERQRDRERSGGQLCGRVAQIQAQRSQHLVVARAADVQPAAGRADRCGQPVFKRGLAVLLVERDAPFAACVLGADLLQGMADRLQVPERQQALRVQHLGMRDRGAMS